MAQQFGLQNLKPIIDLHSLAIDHLLEDLENIRNGKDVVVHLAFSALYPMFGTRSNLDPYDYKHHYDIAARHISSNLHKVSSHIRYKIILPTGTIGKLFNHITYKSSVSNGIINRSMYPDPLDAILENIGADLRGNLSSQAAVIALESELSRATGPQLQEGIRSLIDLLGAGALQLPEPTYEAEALREALRPRELFDSMVEELLRQRILGDGTHSISHNQFEATMDAGNIMHPVRLPSFSKNKVPLLFSTQLKRGFILENIGQEEMNKSSRHLFTLFYWMGIIADNIQFANNLDKMIEIVKRKSKNLNMLRLEVDHLVEAGEAVIDVDTSHMFQNTLWRPFMKYISNSNQKRQKISGEESETYRRAFSGDRRMMRQMVEDSFEKDKEALQQFANKVDESTIDPLIYASMRPIQNNERAKKIRQMFAALRAG